MINICNINKMMFVKNYIVIRQNLTLSLNQNAKYVLCDCNYNVIKRNMTLKQIIDFFAK